MFDDCDYFDVATEAALALLADPASYAEAIRWWNSNYAETPRRRWVADRLRAMRNDRDNSPVYPAEIKEHFLPRPCRLYMASSELLRSTSAELTVTDARRILLVAALDRKPTWGWTSLQPPIEEPINTGMLSPLSQLKTHREWVERVFSASRLALKDRFEVAATRVIDLAKTRGEQPAKSISTDFLEKLTDFAIAAGAHRDWFTQAQAASLLGLNPGHVWRLVSKGDLQNNGSTGRSCRINPQSVVEYKQAREQNQPDNVEAIEHRKALARQEKRERYGLG
jgi:hypothetical protein